MTGDERKRQLVVGLTVIAGVAGLILLIASARSLPGVGGEFFGRILGVLSTPFLLEASFIILGFVLVMFLNYWRQRRDGDEFVDIGELREAAEASARENRGAMTAGEQNRRHPSEPRGGGEGGTNTES